MTTMPELPNVSIMDMARNYYRIERDRKYLGCIRFEPGNGWYTAWAGGQQIGTSTSLLGAARHFEDVK